MLLRQDAFSAGLSFLKGALHVHTTRSDGEDAPQTMLKKFEDEGYAFVALTDHRYYNFANYGDNGLTIIPGMEMDRNCVGTRGRGVHCFHTVCLGPEKDKNGYAQDERFEGGEVADQEEFQTLLDDIHAHQNLTVYCHPGWSATPVCEFANLKGNFAMELWNSGCAYENDMDVDNGTYWDRLLVTGHRIFGVAVDDCHHLRHAGKGWVMVSAKNTVPDILDALSAGRFYASCGPRIDDFSVEDGMAHVKCSSAAWIGFAFGRAPTRITFAEAAPLTEAWFRVPEFYTYIRAVVRDSEGRRAWTNPIFLK